MARSSRTCRRSSPFTLLTSTNPNVPFPSTLIIERVAGGKRHKLINARFIVEIRDGVVTDDRKIGSADGFGRVLDETFRICPPVPVGGFFGRFDG